MERPFRLAGGNSGNVSGERAERRDKRLGLPGWIVEMPRSFEGKVQQY